MASAETPSALAAANLSRHQAALGAARHAIADLQASGADVTFAAVAKTSGVARSWLYDQAEIRQLIGRLRDDAPPPALHAERATAESLHQIADALRLELARLRDENKTLREQPADLARGEPVRTVRTCPGRASLTAKSPRDTSQPVATRHHRLSPRRVSPVGATRRGQQLRPLDALRSDAPGRGSARQACRCGGSIA